MKKLFFLSMISILATACANESVNLDNPIPKMVPDHTPYIAGLIEASPDTTHHYPEIVVGYFTDIYTDERVRHFPGVLYKYPGIYSPTLLRQLTLTSIQYGLAFEAEPNATVTVRGPIGTSQEKSVTFSHEGKGIYGDMTYALPRVPNGQYKLRITLPDGRVYGNRTHIPRSISLTVPDSISVPVKYQPFGDGTPKEEGTKPYKLVYQNSPNSFMRVLQFNSDKDREILLLDPDEHFRYTDRSNYLRTGIGDALAFVKHKQDTFYRGWTQNLDKPRNEIIMNKHLWLRFSYFSKEIGKLYFPLLNIFSPSEEWSQEIGRPSGDAAVNNDSTYLFDVSSIRKIGPNGKALPKDSSDAIGFFSGYYSRYKQTTLYPIRNFDLDSVLTAHKKN